MPISLKIESINPATGARRERNLEAEITRLKTSTHGHEAELYSQLLKLYQDIHKHQIEGFELLEDGTMSEDEKKRRFEQVISLAITQRSKQAVDLLKSYQIDTSRQATLQTLQKHIVHSPVALGV